MTTGVFVTGTDTGVGKTLASCVLIHALRSRGQSVRPMKPIAAGVSADGLNDDTVALLEAAGRDRSEAAFTTPVLLREPMAPHIAAAREGHRISLAPVREAFSKLAATGKFVVAEGVGGFLVPLDRELDSIGLAQALGLPVVLVVGLRLGCLNHALLTARAIASSGLPFAGWIANAIDPAMAVADENVATLTERLPAPLLGRLPHAPAPDARALARHLDVSALLAR